MVTSASRSPLIDDPLSDERWQLVQRIVASPPFQKSGRLRDLLQYIAQQTIRGYPQELNEQHIGEAVFGKRHGYSPLEDSSVRVHVRQLRLKLHEYFDGVGRNEPLILEVPKGSYAPTFRAASAKPQELTTAEEHRLAPATRRAVLPWILCAILAALCVNLFINRPKTSPPAVDTRGNNPPWPFAQVFDPRHQTLIVVADGNYGMFRILTGKRGSLDEYLRRDFEKKTALKLDQAGSGFGDYIFGSTLTSFADVANVVSLLKLSGPLQKQVSVRSARDLRIRDLDHGNYVFIGSPASNPWVSLFEDKLNFRETEGVVGKSLKAFVNTKPLPGEQTRYEGLRSTGSDGDDYATIALLPNNTQDGSVLILQGLQQEGTEAAGRFLADTENREQVQRALGIPLSYRMTDVWFEALIRSRTVSGAPSSTELVAIRRIH